MKDLRPPLQNKNIKDLVSLENSSRHVEKNQIILGEHRSFEPKGIFVWDSDPNSTFS